MAEPATNGAAMAIAGTKIGSSPLGSTYDSGLFFEYAYRLQLAVSLRQRFGSFKNNGSGLINRPISAA